LSSDEQTTRNKDEKKMFVMRMLLGNAYLCNNPNPPKFNREPCCKCNKDVCHCKNASHYDSVIGDNGKKFREFVVYSREHCYPEYLITYERV